MAADIATLGLRVDASQAKSEVQSFGAALDQMGEKGVLSATLLKNAFGAMAASVSAGVLFKKFIDETSQAQFAMAQLEARVKSTGGVAGVTAQQLAAFSSELEGMSIFADDAIQKAQAMLLTFDQIRGPVVGEATRAIVDMATAMGTDLQGAAIQVGKALQDPEQGLTALRRSGVSFSEEQIKLIKHLFDTGRALEGQRLILAELTKEFGGAAKAARDTFGGALEHLKNRVGNVFEGSPELTRVFVKAMDEAAKAADWVAEHGHYLALIPEGWAHASDAANAYAKALAGAAAAWAKNSPPAIETEAQKAYKASVAALVEKEVAAKRDLAVTKDHLPLIERTLRAERARAEAIGAITEKLEAEARVQTVVNNMHNLSPAGNIGLTPTTMDPRLIIHTQIENAKTTATKKGAEERNQIEENFLRQWQQSIASGIEGILTTGLSSWRGFFDSLKSLWMKIVADMFSKKVMEGPLKGVLEGLFGIGGAPGAAPGSTATASTGSGKLAGLGAGITGAIAGYGSQNPWSGALSGAISGFTMTGNPWGAVIGGVAGLVGGLFGQAEAARKAADQMKLAREQFDVAMGQFTLRATGAATPFTEAIAQVNATTDALIAQAKASGTYESTFLRIAELRKMEIDRLTELEAIKQREMQQDYQVRTLRAQGLSEEAAALALAQAQEREYNKAKQEGATAATLAALATAQAAEKQRFLIDQQIAGIEKQIAAYDQQVSAARAVVDATRAIRDTLRDYVTGLTRQGMSPTEQLFASRGDFTSALAAAQGGDRTAAQKLPQLADAFLSLSKVFNASGAGFQEDRTLVQTSLSSLADDFTAQLTVQEQQLAALEAIRAAAQAQLDAIKAADEAAKAAAKAALAAIQANGGSTGGDGGTGGAPKKSKFTIEEDSIAAIVEPMLTELRAVVNSLVGGFTVQGEKLDALSAGITDVATQVRRMREVVNT